MKKETLKVGLVTVLCLGLFGLALTGINKIVLAGETEEVSTFDVGADISSTDEVLLAAEESTKPEMTMNVILGPESELVEGAMSPEAAADLGAQYIWDMFGESIDGKIVVMHCYSSPYLTRTSWIGSVIEPEALPMVEKVSILEDMSDLLDFTTFSFTVDAITGERIGLCTTAHWTEPSEEVAAVLYTLQNVDVFVGKSTADIEAMRNGGTAPEVLDEHFEAVKAIAARHFTSSEVVNVELSNANALAYVLDENGELCAREWQLVFTATYSNGRVSNIAIVESSKQLIWIDTAMNDVVPGWTYESDEPGVG